MPRIFIVPTLACATSFLLLFTLTGNAASQTVWTGFSHSFSKPLFGDPTAAENQDRITDNVWLTRSVNQGLYNIRKEAGYIQGVSPQDTEWATDLIAANAGKTISAENWAQLEFEPWVTAYGGPGSNQLPFRLTSRNAVVHLITDNIYLDLRFTNWSGAGGSFAYERAVGTITPPSATGDYNENGVVDAADYVLWRETLNQTVTAPGSGADGNMSGTVDPADYEFWRARFGNTVADVGADASVPEPTTMVLMLAAMGTCWSRAARRRPD